MPRSVRVERVWYQREGAARIELGPADMTAEQAAAVADMVSKVRNPVRLARTKGPCSCGDCLGCEIQEMRRRHAA